MNPNPNVAALGRVERAIAHRAASPSDQPAILAYLSDILSTDFLQYAPPEVSAFTRAAIHDARLGKWKTMRALSALLSPRQPLSKESWKEALADAVAYSRYEVPPLTRDEIESLRALLSGPIADFVRERAASGERAPSSLSDFAKLLKSKKLRARLTALYESKGGGHGVSAKDVKAALVVARRVLDELDEHVDARVIDRRLVDGLRDADGRLMTSKLDALPPFVRALLEDPKVGPKLISAVEGGSSVSVHALKKTPDHIIEKLNHFSAGAAGGGFLWIDEYVRSGRKLQITEGDVFRKRTEIEKMADALEEKVAERRMKLSRGRDLDPAVRQALEDSLSIEDPKARIASLKKLGAKLDGGGQAEAFRFARLYERIGAFRATDPRQVLRDLENGLKHFESFRKEVVRVRVHGTGSAAEHGLRGAIESSARLKSYAHRTLVEAVSHDYAAHASESAQKIIYGVGGMAALGVGVHQVLGDGAMHMVMSVLEDIAADVGEVMSVTRQGVPVSDVLRGDRFLGQLATLGGATYLAERAHVYLGATKGGRLTTGFGGLMLGIGSCALTGYTSLYSFFLFRRIARDMGREGKFDQAVLTERARAALPTVARRAAEAMYGQGAEVPALFLPSLQAAFDRVLAKYQGIPVGDELVHALAAQKPAVFDEAGLKAIREAENDIIQLVTSGLDFKSVLEQIAADLSGTYAAMLAREGITVDKKELEPLVARRILPLHETKEIDEARMLAAVEGSLRDVVALAEGRDPRARRLLGEIEAVKATLERVDVGEMIERRVAPELKALAHKAGIDQTVANPVRQMLLLGMIFCVGSLTAIGAIMPALLLGKAGAAALSVLASSESILASAGLSLKQRAHERQLRRIGEEIAAEARFASKS